MKKFASVQRRFIAVVLLLLNLCLTQSLFGQNAPAIEWQSTIGGSNDDVLFSIQQTSDAGYILGGKSSSDISGDKMETSLGLDDYWVIKLDSVGAIEWQNTIGGSDYDWLYSIQQTSDGGYILGGVTWSGISGDKTEDSLGGNDYWVIKLNSSGGIEWQNTIGGSGYDYLISIQQTSDGGYILGGESFSGISGDKTEASLGHDDYWVVKLNTAGTIEWQNNIGGNGSELLFSIQQTLDGGYILGGQSDSGISGDKTETSLGFEDYWVVKLNSIGDIVWQNTIGGDGGEELFSIEQTSEGGYILGGVSWSGISGDKTEISLGLNDYWVIKLNSVGAIEWQNTIGGSDDDVLFSIQQTLDGGYILGGWSNSGISGDKTEASIGFDYWVIKLNSSSAIEWQNTIGGGDDDELFSIKQTSDEGYILGGYSRSGISGDKAEASIGGADYWVVKLQGTTGIKKVEKELLISISPNPSQGNFQLTFPTPIHQLTTLSITNLLGQKLFEEEIPVNTSQQTFDFSQWQKGMYFITIRNKNTFGQKQLVIQ